MKVRFALARDRQCGFLVQLSAAAALTTIIVASGCGMHTTQSGNFGLTQSGNTGGGSTSPGTGNTGGGGGTPGGSTGGGGTSTGTSSSGSPGPVGPTPTASEIQANPTLAFTFLTTAPTNEGFGFENGAVINGANFFPGVASGGLAVLIATKLPIAVPASDLTFPTTLDTLSITVGGVAARMYLVAPTQISFQVPPGLAPGTYPVVVSQGATTVISSQATVETVAPGLFTAANTGAGAVAGETVTFDTATNGWDGPVIYSKNDTTGVFSPLPVTPGAWLVLYGTGWMNRAELSDVQVKIGTTDITPVYAGPQITYPGIDVMILEIPTSMRQTSPQTDYLSVTVGAMGSNTVQVCIAGTNAGTCPAL